MNAQPSYKKVAFFMPTKRPSGPLPRISHDEWKKGLETDFGKITAQQDVDQFYQRLAYAVNAQVWPHYWVKREIWYLDAKLRYYYTHLSAICKAENVYLKQNPYEWLVKFPWEMYVTPLQVPPGSDEIWALAERALVYLSDAEVARQVLNGPH